MRTREDVRELTSYGCLTRMHFVRLLWPGHENEDHTKDVDFTLSGIKKRWQAGYEQTMRAIDQAPWQREVDPLEGVFLHEPHELRGFGRDGLDGRAAITDRAELVVRNARQG